VVVADDGSTDGTAGLVAAFAARVPFPVIFTTEAHDGFRLARVRNRGAALARGDTLLFLDGDSILPPDHVAAHLERRRRGWAQIGDVARLPEAVCRDLDPASLHRFDPGAAVPAEERRRLVARHRRSLWHGWIGHPTKPRLAGGNFAVWRDDFVAVNGFDERFRGWGQEDDDLGLRLRAAGVRLEPIIDRTMTYHVWHATDPTATPRWRDGSNVAYFLRRGRLTTCRHGLAERPSSGLLWGLPADLGDTAIGRLVDHALTDAPRAAPHARCEIDLVVHPGKGRFHRPAECRAVLVAAPDGEGLGGTLRRRADRIVTVDAPDSGRIAALLAALG